MVMNSTLQRIKDKVRRNKYIANQIRMGLRFQMRALRKDRNLTQAELAELIGTKQSVISRVESRDADKLSIPTLLKLAEALDVGLVVRFEPIDTVAGWYDNLSPEKLAPQKSEKILEELEKPKVSDAVSETEEISALNDKAGYSQTSLPQQIGRTEGYFLLDKPETTQGEIEGYIPFQYFPLNLSGNTQGQYPN